MNILAIDTTALTSSAAIVFYDGCKSPGSAKIIALSQLNTSAKHSEAMLPMIESMLKSAKMSISDIDMFALSEGPGSFTGVRIGVSLIKGLAFGTGKPCVGVSTLDALARNLSGYDGVICPVMDARRSQFYTALYRGKSKLTEDDCISADSLRELIIQNGSQAVLVGDGAELAERLIALDGVKRVSELLVYQNAYSVAVCAAEKFQNNKNLDFSDSALSPVYLRLPQAERERLERMNNNENN